MLTLNGIFSPIVTPFETEEVSYAHLAENIKKWNKYDLSGYVLLGSNGENVMLRESEGIQIIETVVKYVPNGKKIIVGAGGESTRNTIDFIKKAHRIGGDAALVIPPYYYKDQMKPAVIIEFFREVAENSPMPIIIYNVPKFTGTEVSVDSVVKLAEHPNIIGMKDSSGNLTYQQAILGKSLKGFQLLTGTANTLMTSLLMGATGGILALANIAPQLCLNIYHHTLKNKLEPARILQLNVIQLNQLTTTVHGIGGLKYAMDQIGFYGGNPRKPLPLPDAAAQGDIKNELKKLKLV